MSPSREVQSLYAIADRINSRKPLKETLDAKALLKLIKKESVAFSEPGSSKLREFVNCFRHCQAVAARSPGSEQQKDSILQFLINLDECFFFKTLTREVETKRGRQRLVTLGVEDSSHPTKEVNDMKGIWRPPTRTITLWLKGEFSGEDSLYYFPIESILHTCLHESIHAFIWFFENDDHPKHEERVGRDGGHGSIFIEMLRVIGERIGELVNCREWIKARQMDPYGPKEKQPDPIHPPIGNPGFGGPGVTPGGFPGGFPPGGFPPGGFPPGGGHSGGFPPGDFPPSGFPPGRGPPGGFPPGGFPPGRFPPGAAPGGFPPSGFVPGGFVPGGFPPGGIPPGRFPPGGFPPGGFPPHGFPPGGSPFHR
ncbi:hypothetical protein F4859DRAFT_517563 [Xylaria cf. heliscus]|nr:hypothetical protein F4859DRAFT_517563 [Xylaria cf. heliscus]